MADPNIDTIIKERALYKALLTEIYERRCKKPEEQAFDGIPMHFISDLRMEKIAHALGHTEYKHHPGW